MAEYYEDEDDHQCINKMSIRLPIFTVLTRIGSSAKAATRSNNITFLGHRAVLLYAIMLSMMSTAMEQFIRTLILITNFSRLQEIKEDLVELNNVKKRSSQIYTHHA